MFAEKFFGNLNMDMIACNDSEESVDKLTGVSMTKYQTAITDLGKALLVAARAGQTAKVHELMSRGAPFSADWLGTTPLHLAARHNHIETCKVLLRAGISKDSKTKVDRTPLHLAVYYGHIEVVELLLSNKCEVDARDMLKMTALHWAVQNQQNKIVEMLLQHGADPNAVSKFAKTPIQIAHDTGQMELVRILLLANQMRAASSEQTGVQEATDSLIYELKQHKERHMGTGTGNEHVEDDEDNITMDLSNDGSISNMSNGSHHLDDAANDTDNLIEKEDSLSDVITNLEQSTETDPKNLDSSTLQMLKEHGIALMPSDDTGSLITSAIQSGRKIVLSEAGKFALKETKNLHQQTPVQQQQQQQQAKPVIHTTHTAVHTGGPNSQYKSKMIKIFKKTPSSASQQHHQQQQHQSHVQQHVQPSSTNSTAMLKTNKVIKILTAEEFKQICGGEVGSIKRLPQPEYRKTITPTAVRVPISNRSQALGMSGGAMPTKQISKVVMKGGHRIPVTTGGLNVLTATASSELGHTKMVGGTATPSIANGGHNRHIITSADGVKRLRTATGMEIISSLPTKLPQDTIVSVEASPRLAVQHRISTGHNSHTSSHSGQPAGGGGAANRMIELHERQIQELKKLTEDLQKKYEQSQKQNEDYRARVDKLEREVQKLQQRVDATDGLIEII